MTEIDLDKAEIIQTMLHQIMRDIPETLCLLVRELRNVTTILKESLELIEGHTDMLSESLAVECPENCAVQCPLMNGGTRKLKSKIATWRGQARNVLASVHRTGQQLEYQEKVLYRLCDESSKANLIGPILNGLRKAVDAD